MLTDRTTLSDLSILDAESMGPVLEKLNLAATSIGKMRFQKNLCTPLSSVQAIIDRQQTIACIGDVLDSWPTCITNGTLMVIEKFLESPVDPIPEKDSGWNAFFYKLLHGPDYSLALYSAEHCMDLLKGLDEINEILRKEEKPESLKKCLDEINGILNQPDIRPFVHDQSKISKSKKLALAARLRHQWKHELTSLMSLFATLDSWYGMAMAMKTFRLSFPEFTDSENPLFEAEGLFHILLPRPVAADVSLNPKKNFLFLTGANMSGKSTFIKSIGTAAFLAHTGMGVPAKKLRLSRFDGLISNINVTDDIARGESYFFNEVKRIQSAVSRVSEGGHWLVLIDELFKGTNMQDAMKCSLAIIEGLAHSKKSIFVLSSHLYEIAGELQKHDNMLFCYFETEISEKKFVFHYALKPGISSDRIGYRILEQEGVVQMLKKIG